jgi:hypothetical protein
MDSPSPSSLHHTASLRYPDKLTACGEVTEWGGGAEGRWVGGKQTQESAGFRAVELIRKRQPLALRGCRHLSRARHRGIERKWPLFQGVPADMYALKEQVSRKGSGEPRVRIAPSRRYSPRLASRKAGRGGAGLFRTAPPSRDGPIMAAARGLPGSRKQAVRGGRVAGTRAEPEPELAGLAGGLEPDVSGASPHPGAAGKAGAGRSASGCGGAGWGVGGARR